MLWQTQSVTTEWDDHVSKMMDKFPGLLEALRRRDETRKKNEHTEETPDLNGQD